VVLLVLLLVLVLLVLVLVLVLVVQDHEPSLEFAECSYHQPHMDYLLSNCDEVDHTHLFLRL
jgi:hypothetical protein